MAAADDPSAIHRQSSDDRGPGALFLYAARRLEAVHVRHADVHEHDVGQLFASGLDGLTSGLGLTHDGEVLGLREHRRDALPHELVIVDEKDADRHRGDSRVDHTTAVQMR